MLAEIVLSEVFYLRPVFRPVAYWQWCRLRDDFHLLAMAAVALPEVPAGLVRAQAVGCGR